MVRKIRKNHLAFPFVGQDSEEASDGFRESEQAPAVRAATRPRSESRALRSTACAPSPRRRETAAFLAEPSIGEHIARELKGIYEPIVAQPTPDRFIELLNRLEAGAIYCEKAPAREK
ncbi:MAG TPA: NepR family anti-sigma factor [Methylocystis sp.]|nr:NepR family anti-sigma factor [Methylocystis sp.]